MKKNYVVILGLLLFSLQLSASHISGVDLTYQWVSGNTYKITVSYYRDCKGVTSITGGKVPFNGSCTAIQTSFSNVNGLLLFSYYSPTCGLCAQDTFPNSSLVVTPVPLTCPGAVSTCQDTSSTIPGYEKWTFSKNVTFPTQCTDWTICFEAPTRNAYLTTITSPTGQNAYVTALINNLDAPGSSSPVFSTPNVAYLCAGQPFCFNQGAIDPNGDSLVYSLFQPISIPGTPGSYLAYNAGYTYTSPFGSGSPMTLSAQTGAMCVTPSLQLITVTDVQVSKYRNGVLIGSVIRDLQFVVTPCNNDQPLVSGINGTAYTSNHVDSVCAGQQLCFNINGIDTIPGDTLTMTWDNGISNATFNVTNNNTHSPVAHFCWTPAMADTSVYPYSFTVTIHNNACPYEGIQYFPYSVRVNSCSASVLPPVAAFASNDSSLCSNDCISFTDKSTNNPTSWLWTFTGASPSSSVSQNPPFVCYQSAGNFPVTLVATNAGGSDTITLSNFINVLPAPNPPTLQQSHDTIFCVQTYASYQWYDSSAVIPGATGNSVKVYHNGNYNIKVTDANGCFVGTGITVNITAVKNYGGSFMGVEIYPNPATDKLFVLNNSDNEKSRVTIYNALGEVAYEAELMEGKTAIDISNLSPQIYFVSITNKESSCVMKFVKAQR